MSYYLIGIGGTGARCMEAFVHLTGAGLLKDNQPIKLVYVDADVSCGNLLRAQQTVDLYEKVRKLRFGDEGIFKNEIISSGFWCPVEKNCNTLDEVLQSTALINKKDTKPLGMLYESLFTKQERTTNLDKGFRGHPAIGAAVMTEKMNMDDEPWKTLLPQINADKDAKIFLFASVFGGTGAAGFPTIARLLKDALHKDAGGNCVANIGGALVLPYFQFPPADDENRDAMQAKVDEFMLNTKSALDYYNENNLLGPVFTSVYMVGDNDLAEVKKFSLGSKAQENEANIVEMYAALAAFDFFNKNEYDRGSVPMIGRKEEDCITWDDLPDVCVDGRLKDKMATYIRFLYAYRWNVLESLEKIAQDESYDKYVAWYKDLVKKAGGIDVYHDKAMMEHFKDLGEYAERFFAWMYDIINSSPRSIKLVNQDVCSACVYDSDDNKKGLFSFWKKEKQKFFKLDIYQVVLPITERKDKLDGKTFWQSLCNYTKQMKKTEATGSEILMQAIQNICK
ncbi:hypothetical protein [Megasphaera sp.]|uniref:hypothetical protein n=1 Tax=Megasphaera sp. TaxID=2023260 RepID=UPI0030788567